MAIVRTDDQHYKDIADAIREKTGGTEDLLPENMAEELNNATLEELTVTPSSEVQTFEPTSPCIGFSIVTVEAAESGGGGGEVLPDDGDSGNYQEKTVTPSDEEQVVTPDDEYDALSKVTVEAIDIPYASDSDAQFGSLGGGLIVDDWSTGSSQSSSRNCVGYAFSVKSPCTLTEYQVYASNKRGVTVHVWDDATQSKLAETKHTTITDFTWETGTFAEPVNLTPGRVYVLSFEPTVSGQTSARSQAFSNPGPAVAFNDSVTFVENRWNSRGQYPSTSNGHYIAMVNATFSITASEGRPSSLRLHSGELDALTEEVKRITGITGTMTFSDTLAALKTVPSMS